VRCPGSGRQALRLTRERSRKGHQPQEAPVRSHAARRPDLIQLKRQAKELLKAFGAGEIDATAEVNAHYQGAHRETFALHDAQLVLARSYGFPSWPKLKAYVDGVTVRRLADAVRAGDLATARSMLAARPELVNLCVGENDEPAHCTMRSPNGTRWSVS
jgi:hypothetical protein